MMDETPNEPEYTTVPNTTPPYPPSGTPPYPPPGTPPYPPPGTPQYPPPVASGLSENTAAALAYFTFIPAIIFLIVDPYNKSRFVRFHSFQSIGLCVASFVLHFIVIFIPFLGHALSLLLSLGFFIVWLITILKASRGEWFKLPVIGDFALKQAQS